MAPRRTPPEYLTSGFRHVAERYGGGGFNKCWLWQFDPKGLDCQGRAEAMHLIGQQRIRNFLGPKLQGALFEDGTSIDTALMLDLLEIIEWDGRNAKLGCVSHHRRFDGHADSPDAPKILVPAAKMPTDTLEFVADFGLEIPAEERFEQVEPGEIESMVEGLLNPPPLLDVLEASARGFSE